MTTGTLGLATNLVQGFTTAAARTASPPPAPFSLLPLREAASVKAAFVAAVASSAAAFDAAADHMIAAVSSKPSPLSAPAPPAMTNTEGAGLRISRRL